MKSVVLAFLFVYIASPLLAQTPSTPARSIPPGFVDGSKNPELIPDRAAFRLVFLSLSVPVSPDEKATAKQEALLRAIGLSDSDKAALQQALITFAAEHAQWQEKAAAASGGSLSPQLEKQGWDIIENTRLVLGQQLTSEGNARFVQYVTKAKPHMIVRP